MKRFLLLLILVGQSVTCFGWTLEYDKDDIKVYTREVKGSDFKAFRGTAIVNSSLINTIAHHVNLESMTNWLQDCAESELLSMVNEHQFYLYQRTDAPWPVSDRDYVLHMSIQQDPLSFVVTMPFEATTEVTKSSDDCVRVTSLSGYWRFTPLEAFKVLVEYETQADPAGSIPAWLANSFVVDQPLGTLQKLKERVESKTYTLPETMYFIQAPDQLFEHQTK